MLTILIKVIVTWVKKLLPFVFKSVTELWSTEFHILVYPFAFYICTMQSDKGEKPTTENTFYGNALLNLHAFYGKNSSMQKALHLNQNVFKAF